MNDTAGNSQILMIDDDRELGEMITDFLATDHLDVSVRHTGEDGIEAFRAGSYDLLMKGKYHLTRFNPEDNVLGKSALEKCIEMDPDCRNPGFWPVSASISCKSSIPYLANAVVAWQQLMVHFVCISNAV